MLFRMIVTTTVLFLFAYTVSGKNVDTTANNNLSLKRTTGHSEETAKQVESTAYTSHWDKPRSTSNLSMESKDIEKRSQNLQFMNNFKLKETIKGDENLDWPDTYNVEATKLHLTSGLVEHLKYWKSTTMSRLDCNNGAVTRISNPHMKIYGIQYEIHPETTEEVANKKVCYKKMGTMDNEIEDIDFLPSTSGFERVGTDIIREVDCVKFTRKINNDDERILYKEDLWVTFDSSTESMVPVRYESQTGNIHHGYLTSHEIYDYFNFQPKVNKKVFRIYKNYECIEKENDDEGKTTRKADSMKSLKAEENKELDGAFDLYKRRFNKKYSHQTEHDMRKKIFHQQWRLVTETNHRNLSYKLALNKMSDRTKEELKRYRGLRREKGRIVGNVRFPYSEVDIKQISETLPSNYDLRLEGVVGPVLDQDDCGSCWTFGTTAAVEGALARSNGGTLITLSNQALLDCSWGMGNGGCDGGLDTDAYKWIMKHGLPTVAEYGPYVKEDGYCNIGNMTTTYKIRGWTDVTPFSEVALKIAVIKHGPLSVAIDATDAFSHYDGGIFYDTTCGSSESDMNHEVTLVGYGEKDGESFWIIRNSYGPYWGLDGYMHISTRNNNCGIMTEPTYVVIK